MKLSLQLPSPLTLADANYLDRGIELYIKRDELIHPWINGNKWRKLQNQVNDIDADTTLLTFGGAFSNHLVAVAAYGFYSQVRTVGFVRSYKADEANPIIKLLRSWGMDIHYLYPEEYKAKEKSPIVQRYIDKCPQPIKIIPEGGTCHEAVAGTQSIMSECYDQLEDTVDIVALCIGTGGTLAGVANGCRRRESIVAFSPFKGELSDIAGMKYIRTDVASRISYQSCRDRLRFGQYDESITEYIHCFYKCYNVLLDPIYTARGMRSLDDMIKREDILAGQRVLFIHTGGLSGIIGYNYLHYGKSIIDIPADYKYLQSPSTA